MSLSDTWVNFRDNLTGSIMDSANKPTPAQPVTSNPTQSSNSERMKSMTSSPLFIPAIIAVVVVGFLIFRKG